MTATQSINTMQEDRWSYLWLAIGALLFVVGNGRWTIPVAAWLWPVFMLRFTRTQKPGRGLIIAAIVFMAECNIQWTGVMLAPLFTIIMTFAAAGLAYTLPFLLDRFITPRLKGTLSTLVFPLAWTTLEYAISFGPNGAWGSMAYTQYGNLPLEQIVSVTGVYGITFLITWLTSVVNMAWEREFALIKIRRGVGLYAFILALVLISGGARLTFFPPDSKTVRVASVVAPPGESIITLVTSRESRTLPPVGKTIEVMENLSEKAARSGARIVNWNEYAFRMNKREEAAFINRACKLALRENIYLLLPIGVFREEPGSLVENKLVFIDSSGKVLWQYLKGHPVPKCEEPFVVTGDIRIPVSDTPLGKIAAVICFDLDFPAYIHQAGQAGADLLLGPSEDWAALLSTHTQAATFRAIENGFSMVRCTYEGLTMAVDYQGRTITEVNYFRTSDSVIISDIPMKGVTTIYSKIGDLFAWLCCTGLIVIVAGALFRRKTM